VSSVTVEIALLHCCNLSDLGHCIELALKSICSCNHYYCLSVCVCEHRERGGAKWESSLKDDIVGECNQFGGVLHIYIDRDSEQGNVYIKCANVAAAISSVNALHGRFYAGQCHHVSCLLHICVFIRWSLLSVPLTRALPPDMG